MKEILTVGAVTICLALGVAAERAHAQDDGMRGPPPDRGGQWMKNMRGRRGAGQRGEFSQRLQGIREVLDELKTEDPEEFERLMQLRRTDKRAFMKEIHQLAQKKGVDPGRRGPRRSAEEQKCEELARLYHETDDAAEKERIKGELKAAILAAFSKRLEMQRQRLGKMEEQIEKIRNGLAEREQNKAKICETRLEELTRDPALRWEPAIR